MKKNLAQRVKELRTRKGMSQENLADESGLSLRTIQRIENEESNPTGDSLKRLSNALDVTPDDLVDWTVQEDRGYISAMNLSALSFLAVPLMNVILPLILWFSKKGKVKGLDKSAKTLINFQLTWTILLVVIPVIYFMLFLSSASLRKLSFNSFGDPIFFVPICWFFMYLYNFILIIINTFRINKNKSLWYHPKINFIR